MFLKKVNWCGRNISQDRIKFDPRKFAAPLGMKEPVTGAYLQQFLCASKCMRSEITEFKRLMAPLAALMETVYTEETSLKQDLWDKEHSASFKTFKKAL